MPFLKVVLTLLPPVKMRYAKQEIVFKTFLSALFLLKTSCKCGLNDLHLLDGTSSADFIGNDVFFEIVQPEDLQYTYAIRPALNFGAPFNSSTMLKNVLLVPTEPEHSCVELFNAEAVEGNVAFIERGECSFKVKAIMAERAGARAVIITDETVATEEFYIEMVDDDSEFQTNIPAGFLLGKNGKIIRQTLARLNMDYAVINLPVNLTFIPIHKINQPPWVEW